jgi:hypothetical protein
MSSRQELENVPFSLGVGGVIKECFGCEEVLRLRKNMIANFLRRQYTLPNFGLMSENKCLLGYLGG